MSDESRRMDSNDGETPVTPDDRRGEAGSNGGDAEHPQILNVARPGGRRAFLQTLSRGAAVGASAVVGDSCNNKTPTAPTASATTTTSTSTTTVTSVSTTTAPSTSTLAGVVSDQSGRAVGGCRVFVVDGPNANRSSTTDGNGYYSIAGLVAGSFTLRTTCNNVFVGDRPVTIGRDTRLDFSVTITTTTTTTTSSATSVLSTTTTGGGGGGHYWYPN